MGEKERIKLSSRSLMSRSISGRTRRRKGKIVKNFVPLRLGGEKS